MNIPRGRIGRVARRGYSEGVDRDAAAGRDVNIPRGRIAAPPRGPTWIFRGGGSRRGATWRFRGGGSRRRRGARRGYHTKHLEGGILATSLGPASSSSSLSSPSSISSSSSPSDDAPDARCAGVQRDAGGSAGAAAPGVSGGSPYLCETTVRFAPRVCRRAEWTPADDLRRSRGAAATRPRTIQPVAAAPPDWPAGALCSRGAAATRPRTLYVAAAPPQHARGRSNP